ncbi:MAG TPA: hypothetical protein VK666_28270 [Chryseolinea sp.]|nr:hypothetical protein [Chryseolinea sp.]
MDSCDRDDDVLVGDNSYLPLEIGNYWDFVAIGGVGGQQSIVEHREVMGKTFLSGHEYFLMVSERPTAGDPFIDSVYYRVADNGYVYTYRTNFPGEAQDFRLNGKDGDEWTYTYVDWETNIKLTASSLDINSNTISNCKNFYRDVRQWADEEYTITLAPDVGFVKEFSNAWGGGQVLKSARIGGRLVNF